MRDNQILFIVSTVCERQETTSSRWVCRDTNPEPHNGGWGNGGHDGGGWGGGHDGGGHDGGGHDGGHGGGGGGLTPGPSEPHGGGDPGRPPRFPGMITESSDCYQTYDTSVYVSCLVKDVR